MKSLKLSREHGRKREGEKFVALSQIERYKNGIDEIPEGMKIENDELVRMTYLDKVEAGLLTEEEANNLIMSDVRSKRNRLLRDCDWTQVPDVPTDKEAWANYRQALRDIPQQEGFPENVTWPEKPQ